MICPGREALSTNATSVDRGGSLSVSTDVLAEPFVQVVPAAGGRGVQLRRQLLSADILSGSVCGTIVCLAAGLGWQKIPLVALAIGLGWPVLAYVCGLYASEDLRSWASGIGDAPRLAVTSLLLSWPLFGLLTALGATEPVVGALLGTALAAGGAALTRAGARAALHRSPELRQRTIVLGSGDVARQLVERML